MSLHGIHHDAMTAQAQYAEWLRRLQAETRARVALKTDELEREREATSDQSDEEPEAGEQQPEAEPNSDDEGHFRSFA
jgi:hypothetical protein